MSIKTTSNHLLTTLQKGWHAAGIVGFALVDALSVPSALAVLVGAVLGLAGWVCNLHWARLLAYISTSHAKPNNVCSNNAFGNALSSKTEATVMACMIWKLVMADMHADDTLQLKHSTCDAELSVMQEIYVHHYKCVARYLITLTCSQNGYAAGTEHPQQLLPEKIARPFCAN